MKVLHVISGISRKGGGPSRSSQGLVKALCEAGVDAWIHSFDQEEPWVDGVRAFRRTEGLDAASLKEFDLVHIHGIWDRRLHAVAKLCRKAKVPYVIAPRGMLEPWSLQQKWLKKRIARFLYQDRDLKKAAALHATAESEKEQFRKLGFKNYCIVSPNGVNLPLSQPQPSTSTSDAMRRALFVSRMHPKKGVMELVEAWARVKPEGWICELVYTKSGAEELAYEQKVKDRILALGMSYQDNDGTIHSPTPTSHSNFILTGPLDDDKKWEAYARADLFILPTYSENFGIVIAEALWAGVPVITTKGTPWKDLEDHNCGWWIDTGVDALETCLCSTLNTPTSALAQMGAFGHSLIEQKYTWKAAIGAMKHGYEQAINTCELAPCDDCRNYGDTCPIK